MDMFPNMEKIMENNVAFVATLKNIQPIENADNIVKADVTLNNIKITQVVVGKGTIENTQVVYFDSNLVLNEENLLSIYPKLADYLSTNKRVKIVKLRGEISNGLAVEVDQFYIFFKNEKEAKDTLIEGFSFTEINGKEICEKYFPPIKGPSNTTKTKPKDRIKIVDGQFNFHADTTHLVKNLHMIDPYDVISISNKIHGSSFICSNSLIKRHLNIAEKILKKIGVKIVDTEYKEIAASRNSIRSAVIPKGTQYKKNLWAQILDKYFLGKLYQGEHIYGEIYGYTDVGTPIQKSGKFIWNYGCEKGESKIAVYRINKIAPDGTVIEYSWKAMKERCAQLGVSMVEEIFYGRAKDLVEYNGDTSQWRKSFIEFLTKNFLDKPATDCIGKDIHQEGIVIRVEGYGLKVFKHKDETFMLQTRSGEEKGEIIDIEDESQV